MNVRDLIAAEFERSLAAFSPEDQEVIRALAAADGEALADWREREQRRLVQYNEYVAKWHPVWEQAFRAVLSMERE